MNELSNMQSAVIGHVFPDIDGAPDVNVVIDFTEREKRPDTYQRWGPAHDPSARPSLAGYSAVYEIDGQWFARHESDGGMREQRAESREDATAKIHEDIRSSIAFWMEKVAYRNNGDMTTDRNPRDRRRVIRASGTHYILGPEPSDRELRNANRSGYGNSYGMAGRQLAFRMLDTGERVQSRNCWYQGRIPTEFAELLPDNAQTAESDESIRMREAHQAWRDQQEAKRLERAWRDEANRARRGPSADLTEHDRVLQRERITRAFRRIGEERAEAEHLEAKWRADAYRAFRGTWVDLIGFEQECWEMEQEYYAELWHDYQGSVL